MHHHQLVVGFQVRIIIFASRGFNVADPSVWNWLPSGIRLFVITHIPSS